MIRATAATVVAEHVSVSGFGHDHRAARAELVMSSMIEGCIVPHCAITQHVATTNHSMRCPDLEVPCRICSWSCEVSQ